MTPARRQRARPLRNARMPPVLDRLSSFTRPGPMSAPGARSRLLLAALAGLGLLALAVPAAPVGAHDGETNPADAPAGHSLFVPGATRAETFEWAAAIIPGVSHRVLGQSVEGRDIEAWRFGEGESVVVLVGAIHGGEESVSGHLVDQLFEAYVTGEVTLPAGITLVAVPWANPDGFAMESRLNANEVDLNRNWPTRDWQPIAIAGDDEVSAGTSPLSEPESRALWDLLLLESPAFVLSYHGFGGLVEDNGVTADDFAAADDLAHAYAAAAEYDYIEEWPYYELTGQFIDAMGEVDVAAADVELLPGDDTNFERNLHGLEAAIDLLTGTAPEPVQDE